MNDIQILIENIRKSIAFSEIVSPEQIQLYARNYAEYCTQLDRRMLQCIQQIRTGNIAEGVRLAELKPNLTELYLSLDIPEREEWDEIISTLGYDIAPPIPEEMFKELGEAYLKVSPLEPLLRWHRLYALNNSSVRERLAVLRSLSRKDPENISWAEDLEKFEKARIKELEKEIRKAIDRHDLPKIHLLHSELTTQVWRVAPPPDFRWKLTDSVLRDYANSLMKKYDVLDYDSASKIYDTMQQILATDQRDMPPAISQLIRPTVQWLDETREYNTAFWALRDALAEERAAPDLERLYYRPSLSDRRYSVLDLA